MASPLISHRGSSEAFVLFCFSNTTPMLIRIVPNRNEAKGMSSLQPPPIPPDIDYQAYYCEENIWRLCQQPQLQVHKSEVVFISNPRRTCALWYQRAAPYPTEPVVWDYHVILLTQTPDNIWQVWDLDTLLGCPLQAEDYFSMTFGGHHASQHSTRRVFALFPPSCFSNTSPPIAPTCAMSRGTTCNRPHLGTLPNEVQSPPTSCALSMSSTSTSAKSCLSQIP